jgi:hypothetical protein
MEEEAYYVSHPLKEKEKSSSNKRKGEELLESLFSARYDERQGVLTVLGGSPLLFFGRI